MYKEVMKWLSIQHMPVSENYLRLRLETHPDYPSLIAIQDTLEELGIKAYACYGAKEELKKENKPFLAHFNVGEGYILSFKDVASAERKVKDFDNTWSGNVMFTEPTAKLSAGYNSLLKKEKQQKAFGVIAIILIIGALLSLSVTAGSVPATLLVITNCTGLYFSWLIAQKEFGISNSISDKICSLVKQSRCESVLFSKGAKLFNWLTWGDVGIVYFSASLVFLLYSLLTYQPINLYFAISLAGLVFPFYSVYYQWRVVKQWCMLCIAVLAILFINSTISLLAINFQSLAGKALYPFAILAILFAITLSAWQVLKALYKKSLSALSNEIKATRLKRNPEIFNALLEKQEANPINLPEKDEPLQFGNPEAPYQLVIACNPYCGPCAKAHHAVEEVYKKYPDKLSVTVRFALNNNDENDKTVSTAKEIIKAAVAKPFDAIKDWYNLFDLEKFKQLHHTNGEIVDSLLEKHISWNKKIEIKGTPTFFVNGRQLPKIFNWVDFVEALEMKCR